ncbi:MAG: hypothetical protein ACRDL7_05355, partial [Gaiellaceae bacterium]
MRTESLLGEREFLTGAEREKKANFQMMLPIGQNDRKSNPNNRASPKLLLLDIRFEHFAQTQCPKGHLSACCVLLSRLCFRYFRAKICVEVHTRMWISMYVTT